MNWKIEFDISAAKEYKKLDKSTQKEISNYLKNKVLRATIPQDLGKPL
jgi:mRNA-degrading endonuclease RelE of RelBE toxin-antitoxin system